MQPEWMDQAENRSVGRKFDFVYRKMVDFPEGSQGLRAKIDMIATNGVMHH
jgi:hypothetical protein